MNNPLPLRKQADRRNPYDLSQYADAGDEDLVTLGIEHADEMLPYGILVSGPEEFVDLTTEIEEVTGIKLPDGFQDVAFAMKGNIRQHISG